MVMEYGKMEWKDRFFFPPFLGQVVIAHTTTANIAVENHRLKF